MEKNLLQTILQDHLKEIEAFHPRLSILQNIRKTINCGNPSYGGTLFGCESCGNYKFSPFTCHSRFCISCGTKYAIDRSTQISKKILQVTHKHCVFTIDEKLRIYFLKDRTLLHDLFQAVSKTISSMFHKDIKLKNYKFGYICVLHTFGRDLKWNPHIHCLVTKGGFDQYGKFHEKNIFPYSFLRKAFPSILLRIMENKIGKDFIPIRNQCFAMHKSGFYVYAKDDVKPTQNIIRYIGRYLGRPVIALSRIDTYKEDKVTFHYNRHEDEKYVEETLPAINFIKRLIRHIPERHFKQLRYYGIYANSKVYIELTQTKTDNRRRRLFWRDSIYFTFGIDPCICPICNKEMSILGIFQKNTYYTIHEIKEKVYKRINSLKKQKVGYGFL